MSTSATDRSAFKTSFVYLCLSLFVAFFGAVYELFSHEVYSFFMIYAFAFPLIGGTLPFLAMGLYGKRCLYGSAARVLYHCGIATLTVGSITNGILEIYGTTNSLLNVYWIIGIILTVFSTAVGFIKASKEEAL